MAFKATINSIIPVSDGTGSGVTYQTAVTFTDDASSFVCDKTYNFPVDTTQAVAVAAITADGTAMKTMIAGAGNLKNKVGSVITI